MPCGMWDLNSPTRDRTHALCIGSAVLTTGPPGKSPQQAYLKAPTILPHIYQLDLSCSASHPSLILLIVT